MKVEYSSNNSGGSWWLADDDWRALEAAGWDVDWYAENPHYNGTGTGAWDRKSIDDEGRWLRALASSASKDFPSMGEAIAEWERITGKYSNDLGCACCGSPHSFSADGDYYSPSFPSTGERYGE